MVNAFAILALSSVFTTLSLSAPVESVPREPRNIFPQGPSVAVVLDLPTASPLPPPGSTGSFYGNEDLLDYDGNPVQGSLIVEDVKLVPGQLADPNDGLILDFNLIDKPQPIRDTTRESGGTDPGPDTSRYNEFQSDVFASPGTDTGGVAQASWPMGLSHNRLGLDGAGWARQQNTNNLPAAVELAGVDMRLSPNAYRELHWHQAGEWAYILSGSVGVATVDENGQTFVDDLNVGDLWFFPPGVPHSLQALDQGVEFLIIFDNGFFSEDNTSLLTEMFLRTLREVLAKNFKMDISASDDTPKEQLYIFPGQEAPKDIQEQNVTGPAGPANQPNTQFTYHWSQQPALEIPNAGSVKIVDPTTFPAAADVSAALVTIKPGAMREMHWHPQSDEWNFFISGKARITIYQAPSSSQTFDYGAGDVGYIPMTYTHYIENTGSEDVVLLEVLKAPKFTDISVAQWLGLAPRQIVKDTMNLPDSVLDNLPKYKPILMPGDTNLTQTNFTAPF